jgi:hypothetical protein
MNCIDVIKAFEPRVGGLGTLCVAGGAVRDELMNRTPKDFDLFLLYPGEFEFKKLKEELQPRLKGLAINTPSVEWHRSEPYLVADVKLDGVDVQVLVNPAASPLALVQTFDWNVCLFARTEDEVIKLTELDEIASGKELRLNRVTFPLSTLRRGFRFSERFKMKLRKEDVVSLSRMIVANADAKKDKKPNGNEPDMPSLAANTLVN